MSSLPTILPSGYILVYGLGSDAGASGIIPNDTDWQFGTIYQIWDGGATFVYGGDSVMFKKEDARLALIYNGWPYTMIKARLVTKEIIPL